LFKCCRVVCRYIVNGLLQPIASIKISKLLAVLFSADNLNTLITFPVSIFLSVHPLYCSCTFLSVLTLYCSCTIFQYFSNILYYISFIFYQYSCFLQHRFNIAHRYSSSSIPFDTLALRYSSSSIPLPFNTLTLRYSSSSVL